MCAFIMHQGNAGPIINYGNGRKWQVHFWMAKPKVLFARFMARNGRLTKPLYTRNIVPRKAWSFVCASYDRLSGVGKLWLNGNLKFKRNVGRFRLATKEPIRIGVRKGDKRTFRGRISCVQIYSAALSKRQILDAMRRCTKRGKNL